MTLESASVRVVRKPWGRTDPRPWSELGHDGSPTGELWFQRADAGAPEPALRQQAHGLKHVLGIASADIVASER